MKKKHFLLLAFSIIIFNNLFAFTDDTTKVDTHLKSFNVSPALVVGNETGLSFRLEYEDNIWGKAIFNSEIGLYFGSSTHLLIDLGLGYGYPLLHSKSNSIFLNGIATYMMQDVPVGLGGNRNGPSGIIEIEYKKTWNNFSICLAPFYRGFLANNEMQSKSLFYNTIGLRMGIIYSFHK